MGMNSSAIFQSARGNCCAYDNSYVHCCSTNITECYQWTLNDQLNDDPIYETSSSSYRNYYTSNNIGINAFDFQCPDENQRFSTYQGGWESSGWLILFIILAVVVAVCLIPVLICAGCTFGCLKFCNENTEPQIIEIPTQPVLVQMIPQQPTTDININNHVISPQITQT